MDGFFRFQVCGKGERPLLLDPCFSKDIHGQVLSFHKVCPLRAGASECP